MSYIEENLHTRLPLRFGNDGKFKILTFSDLHAKDNYDRRTTRAVRDLVEYVKPDLVLVLGDVVHHISGETKEIILEKVYAYLRDAMSVMEEKKIPWAHIFGNHDWNIGIDNSEQQPLYERFEHCLTKRGPEAISGTGNYMLPLYSRDGGRIVFNLWGLDSHDDQWTFAEYCKNPEVKNAVLPKRFCSGNKHDVIHFDQLMWYWNSSVELERYAGAKIPSLMFFHVPIPEFVLINRNPVETRMKGKYGEPVGCSEINSGLFSAILQRGDVKLIVCGHEHYNTYDGYYCGVHLCYDGGLSYDGYCNAASRGGRVIELDENDIDNYNTHMVFYEDVLREKNGASGKLK